MVCCLFYVMLFYIMVWYVTEHIQQDLFMERRLYTRTLPVPAPSASTVQYELTQVLSCTRVPLQTCFGTPKPQKRVPYDMLCNDMT